MNRQSPLLDRFQHNALLLERLDSLANIQLRHQGVGLVRRQRLESLQVLFADLAQGHQPRVEDTKLLVTQCRSDTSAACMAAQNNMLDAQVTDGILDDRRRAQVGRVQDVGDVTVDKDIARLEAQDGGLGAARVGAADPEDFGALADRKAGEEVGLLTGGFGGPFLVLAQGSEVSVWVLISIC